RTQLRFEKGGSLRDLIVIAHAERAESFLPLYGLKEWELSPTVCARWASELFRRPDSDHKVRCRLGLARVVDGVLVSRNAKAHVAGDEITRDARCHKARRAFVDEPDLGVLVRADGLGRAT